MIPETSAASAGWRAVGRGDDLPVVPASCSVVCSPDSDLIVDLLDLVGLDGEDLVRFLPRLSPASRFDIDEVE